MNEQQPIDRPQPLDSEQNLGDSHTESRWRKIASMACVVLVALALLDASVETFVTRAPLRLPLIAAAILFFAVLALLWRKTGWTAKASLSALFFFAVICVSAWLPDGLENGITIARQPTSVVLSAITALAVVVSGVLLIRLPIPIGLRVAGVLIAVYGTAAFSLGIVSHSSYPALFQGQSFWTHAPRWGQGSFIGVALIPLAILGSLFSRLLRRESQYVSGRNWRLELALVIAGLIAVPAVIGPHSRGLSSAEMHGTGLVVPENPSGGAAERHPGNVLPTANATKPVTPGTDFNLALEDNGGIVERITGDEVMGEPLVDGNPNTVWWGPNPLSAPTEIVLSFYKRQPALVAAVVITLPDPASRDALRQGGLLNTPPTLVGLPKEVEIWASPKSPDSGYEKLGVITYTEAPSTQTLTLPPVEARFLKIRVVSTQSQAYERTLIGMSEIQVLEARRSGYVALRDRNPDLADWKGSPRYAAQRGINWLQPATVRWQREKNCFGCHIQAQSVMGFAIAKKNDYAVNDEVIKELSEFTETQQHADGSFLRDPGEPSTQFAAMGLTYFDEAESIQRNPKFLKTVDWLLDKQKETGEMPYGGFGCQGDAVVQGPVMATGNSLLAFKRAYAETNDGRYKQAADRALAWIESAQPVSTQDEVFKILALAKFGGADQKSTNQSLVERLITEQRPSGGWRECPDHTDLQEPNPFSTGQVLYAFKQAGVSVNSSSFIKGVKYLMDVQQPDGSWKVEPHALHGQGAPYAPSMWAIIGLAGSFGSIQTGSLQIAADLPAASSRNLEIILDDSGSMKLPLGKSTRIGTARQVLRDVLAGIPDDLNVGLRVYAHRYSSRDKQTCTDTELKVPIQKLDRQQILSVVDNLKPKGETPLVYSILQSPADLKSVGGGSVIVITDGEETCGGDPVSAAEQLKSAGIPITLNIVGFTLKGKNVEQQLTQFAQATGGQYYSAQDGEALSRALRIAAMNKFPYEVFDKAGQQVATGLAGPLAEALQPGEYKVVVHAGEQQLTENVTVNVRTDTVLKVVRKGPQFVIEQHQEKVGGPAQSVATTAGQGQP